MLAASLGVSPPQSNAELAALIAQLPGASVLLSYAKAEVKTAALNAVKPYVLGAYAVGGVGILFGLTAMIIAAARR